MNYQIQNVLKKIQEDDYLLSELMGISDIDVLYDFFKEVNGEESEFIPFSDFLKFYDEIFEGYENSLEYDQIIDEEILSKAVGGKNNKMKKILAGTLAALTLASTGGNIFQNDNNMQVASAYKKEAPCGYKIPKPWEVKTVLDYLFPNGLYVVSMEELNEKADEILGSDDKKYEFLMANIDEIIKPIMNLPAYDNAPANEIVKEFMKNFDKELQSLNLDKKNITPILHNHIKKKYFQDKKLTVLPALILKIILESGMS